MRKFVVSSVVALLFVSALFAAKPMSEWKNVAGLDLPTYGWIIRNADGQIVGAQGVNLGLGYSAKYYFSPLKKGEFNVYWGWGTNLLIVPYAVVGGDYLVSDNIYVGGYAGLSLATLLSILYKSIPFPVASVSVGVFF